MIYVTVPIRLEFAKHIYVEYQTLLKLAQRRAVKDHSVKKTYKRVFQKRYYNLS